MRATLAAARAASPACAARGGPRGPCIANPRLDGDSMSPCADGLSTGIMLGAYGVLRAQMARRLGHSLPAAEEGGSWQPPPHRKQLQSWYSDHYPSYHFPSYDEGAWPARRPPPPPSESAPAPTAAPPRATPKDAGFIKPLPFLTAIEWSSTPRGAVPGVGAVQVHGARDGGGARTPAPGNTNTET